MLVHPLVNRSPKLETSRSVKVALPDISRENVKKSLAYNFLRSGPEKENNLIYQTISAVTKIGVNMQTGFKIKYTLTPILSHRFIHGIFSI